MDRSYVIVCFFAHVLLASLATSVRQSTSAGASSSTTGTNDSISPPPPLILPLSSPPPPFGNSLPSRPPMPVPSSVTPPEAPALGSPPPPLLSNKSIPGSLNTVTKHTEDGKEKGSGSGGSEVFLATDDELRNCLEKDTRCGDSLVFCLIPQKDPKFLIFHNAGQNQLNVSIVKPSSVERILAFPPNATKKVQIAQDAVLMFNIVVDNSKASCPLTAVSPPSPKLLAKFPAYVRKTPVYAVYSLAFMILLAGCTWACCRFRKRARRRTNAGIPYRQLEMSMQSQSRPSFTPDSGIASDGWDESWNDAWDDEEAGSGTSFGVTAASKSSTGRKSSAKDGWEDWDD